MGDRTRGLRLKKEDVVEYKRRRSTVRIGLEPLEDRVLLDAGFTALANAVDARLLAIQTGLAAVAHTQASLPIVNQPLDNFVSTAQTALSQFRTSLKNELTALNTSWPQDTLQNRLYTDLSRLGVLRDLAGDGTTQNDLTVTKDPATGDITISMNVGKSLSAGSVLFGLGLPGFPLIATKGNVPVTAGFAYNHLTFGLQGTTPFFDTTNNQFQMNVGARVLGTIRGGLGFLEISATDAGGTGLNINLTTDVTSAGLANPRLDGSGDVNVNLQADFTGNGTEANFNYPYIQSNFFMHWGFSSADPGAGLSSFGDEPDIEFRNVQFGVGTFVSNLLRPIVNTVQEVTQPLKPILDILAAEIPGLSDISEAANLGPVSLESLAALASAAGVLPPDYQLLVDLALTTTQLIQLIDSIPSSGPLLVPVGSFNLSGDNIRGQTPIDFITGLDSPNLTNLIPVAIGAVNAIEDEIPSQLRGVFQFINDKLKTAQNGVGIDFPLLKDPRGGVFKLLLGQDVDFVNFIARFHLASSTTQFIPIWGPVSVRVDGEVDTDAYFKMGYDTYGLRLFLQNLLKGSTDASVLADGFYFDSSQDLLRISGSLSAGLALTAPLPTIIVPIPTPFGPVPTPFTPDVSINGKVSAEDVSVRFGVPDSKFRFFQVRPEPLFQTQGKITAGFNFLVEAGIPGIYMQTLYEKDFDQTTLLDLYNGPLANPADPINVVPPVPPPEDVVLDLSGLPVRLIPGTTIVAPDLIKIDVVSGIVRFYVNGRQYIHSIPLSQVGSIRVIGSDGVDFLTVVGALNRPVTFEGGIGTNHVILDDSATGEFFSQYTVSFNEIKRVGIGAFSTDTVDLHFTNASFFELKASNRTPTNTIQIGGLYNTFGTVVLGQGTNLVNVDTTGGFADQVTILGKTLSNSGLNVLTIQDHDTALDWVTGSGPATYTLTASYQGAAITSTSIIRQKPERAILGKRLLTLNYTATTTIDYSGIDNVAIQGGALGNTFNVQGINPGTHYSLQGNSGNDTFVLGSAFAQLGFVNGSVSIDGGDGRNDSLILDDSADDNALYNPQATYTITGQSIGFSSQEVLGSQTLTVAGNYDYTAIEHLVIKGGGISTFNVYDTPLTLNVVDTGLAGGFRLFLDGDTTLIAGSSFEQFHVLGTTGALTIVGRSGVDQIGIGVNTDNTPSTLDNIHGSITLQDQDPLAVNSVSIEDGASTLPYIYVLDTGQFYRDNADGSRSTATIHFGGMLLNSFFILGGSGGNVFQINDTPMTQGFFANSSIITGTGDDDVFVRGTTGAIGIDLSTGLFQNIYIGDPTHSLDAIQGKLAFTGGGGRIIATVTDEASTTYHATDISTTFGTETFQRFDLGQAVPRITFSIARFTILNYYDGQAGDSIDIEGNPAGSTINVYGNPNAVDEFGISAYTNAILGPVTFFGQIQSDFAVYYDYFNPNPQTYTLKAGGLDQAWQEIDRSAMAPVVFNGTSEVILATVSEFYFAEAGGNNVVNVVSIPAGVTVDVATSGRDQVTVGSNAPGLGGTLANIQGSLAVGGSGGHHVSVTLDNSGDTSTGPRQITLRHGNGPFDSANQIDGLTPNSIAWTLDETSSMTILGGAADETYTIAGADFLPAIRIDGGGGVNTLDYSSYNGLPGLVAWYPGEGNANDVVAGNNGFIHGDVSFVPGKVGQAFSFNGGTGYVEAISSFALEPATVSLEAWVNSSAVGRNQYILDRGASGDVAASYALYTGPDSGLRFYVFDGTTFVESPDAGTGIWDGNWHHVVGTYDGTMVRLYVDGVEVGNGTPTNLTINYSLPTNNDLFIGTYNGQSRYAFNGLIDEPSVFNRALTPAEVQSYFASGNQGPSLLQYASYNDLPGLVAWYSGEGNTHSAGGGPEGTAVGGVTFAPGKVGQAFSFNGVDSYVDLGNDPSLDIPGNLTVETWVNYQTLDHSKYLIANFDESGTVSQGSLGIKDNHFFWYQSMTDGGSIEPEGATTLVPGQWYHVAVVRDDVAKTVTIYVNGQVDAITSYAGTVVGLQQTEVLGTSEPVGFPGDYFHGLLDEATIFNRALSAAEVQGIFEAGSGSKSAVATGIYVNLQTGTATELSGGIANIQNVTGSPFADILVGNGGNVLDGGMGRDLLIAGPFASTLLGGGEEDILIGGTTNIDTDRAALEAVLAAWTQAPDYASGAASVAQLLTATSNGGSNVLEGQDGLDLFFGRLFSDNPDVTDRTEVELFFPI
jgi:hypothetical protein